MITQFEISVPALRQRLLEIFPGFLSWGTLVGLTILAFVVPFWIGIFIIVYDLYALIRAVYMSIHLLYAYRRLKREAGIDWINRCQATHGYHDWRHVHHVIILPTYNESLDVLRVFLNVARKYRLSERASPRGSGLRRTRWRLRPRARQAVEGRIWHPL